MESRLGEVVKENETLIDELQDKKFEVYKLKSKNQVQKELYDDAEITLENKITDMMKKMGNNKKNIMTIKQIVSQTMSEFRSRVAAETDSEIDNYPSSMRKSESFQPLVGQKHLQKSSTNSSESENT